MARVNAAEISCNWPDWGPECGLPACPDSDKVTCVEDLKQDDYPDGYFLEQNIILGVCPACVRYKEYGDECPGINWTGDSFSPSVGNLMFGQNIHQVRVLLTLVLNQNQHKMNFQFVILISLKRKFCTFRWMKPIVRI